MPFQNEVILIERSKIINKHSQTQQKESNYKVNSFEIMLVFNLLSEAPSYPHSSKIQQRIQACIHYQCIKPPWGKRPSKSENRKFVDLKPIILCKSHDILCAFHIPNLLIKVYQTPRGKFDSCEKIHGNCENSLPRKPVIRPLPHKQARGRMPKIWTKVFFGKNVKFYIVMRHIHARIYVYKWTYKNIHKCWLYSIHWGFIWRKLFSIWIPRIRIAPATANKNSSIKAFI